RPGIPSIGARIHGLVSIPEGQAPTIAPGWLTTRFFRAPQKAGARVSPNGCIGMAAGRADRIVAGDRPLLWRAPMGRREAEKNHCIRRDRTRIRKAAGITGALFSFACIRAQNPRWQKS